MKSIKILRFINSGHTIEAKRGDFSVEKERELLEKKVIKGTDFAVREYGEVFKKLAEYDHNLN